MISGVFALIFGGLFSFGGLPEASASLVFSWWLLLCVRRMLLQALPRGGFAVGHSLTPWAALGVGTAMVYPTLLASIGDVAHPSWRAHD